MDTVDEFAASAFADDVRAQFVETTKRCPVKVVDRQKNAPSAILPLDAKADIAVATLVATVSGDLDPTGQLRRSRRCAYAPTGEPC